MQLIFYRVLIYFSRFLGEWFFNLCSRMVAAGYFILFPRRVGVSVDFYRSLYPRRSVLYCLLCTWRQYQNFTTVFLDRVRAQQAADITYTHDGGGHLDRVIASGQGGIILMSHLGNWEVASYLLNRQWQGVNLLLYMGKRQKEAIERSQKQELAASGITIVAIDQEGGSPFDIVEGLRFLKQGGLVAMAGDVIWKPGQRSVTVPFLGRAAELPATPHILALTAQVPLLVFFSFRTAKQRYHFSFSEPIDFPAKDRRERDAAIRRSALAYAELLEAALRSHPFEWYHFTRFLI